MNATVSDPPTRMDPAAAGRDIAGPVLAVSGLATWFHTGGGWRQVLRDVSFHIDAQETLAIVGESGSGKSVTALSIMRLLSRRTGRVEGRIALEGRDLLSLPEKAMEKIRGNDIAMIFQEPMTSLNPVLTIGKQIAELLVLHQGLSRAAAEAKVLELLDRVRIPEARSRIHDYPHQFSGGMRQRVMIAMALACRPKLLIADEPTTALDVTIQAQILTLLAELQSKLGMAIVFITHDLGIVRRFADRVYVMRSGEVVEEGGAEAVFSAPRHAYTKMLLAAEPAGSKAPVPADAPVLLEGRAVEVVFRIGGGFLAGEPLVLRAVDGVSVRLKRGQTIGIVGESGSGKSTLGRALLRLLPSGGVVRFAGSDISHADRRAMQPLRRQLQLVFQDPFGSLSPRMTVGQIVAEGLLVHEPGLSFAERDRRAVAALAEVGLDPNARNRYPHEFSGGQRQRIAIARAMILKPKEVVLDEPTSALDRSVQKQIVELLRGLQADNDLSYLFISHDLAVVRAMADYVMVMKEGRVVEEGPTEAIFEAPREAYTQALMEAAINQTRFRADTAAAGG